MTESRLAPKQACFVEEYLLDLNATQAAIRAGYSKRTASEIGYELLRKPEIQSAIQAAMRARSHRTGISQDRVLHEIALIGFADLADFVDWGPRGVVPKESSTLDPEKRRAIVEVSQTQHGMRVKLADKNSALEKLSRHLGLYSETPDENEGDRVVVYLPDNGRN